MILSLPTPNQICPSCEIGEGGGLAGWLAEALTFKVMSFVGILLLSFLSDAPLHKLWNTLPLNTDHFLPRMAEHSSLREHLPDIED